MSDHAGRSVSNAQPLQQNDRTYSEVVHDLRKASIPVQQLHGRGHVAVTPVAGRIMALAFSERGPNLVWTCPGLGDTVNFKALSHKLVGGIGGDRLWFAPELCYHWIGKPDWQGLSNNKVPLDTDPGRYIFLNEGPGVVALAATGKLRVQGTDEQLGFSVERRIRMTDPPLHLGDPLMRAVDYVGIETTHTLTLAEDAKTGEIDLWHLLQVPVGTILIVPLRSGPNTEPLCYGLPGGWKALPDRVVWRFEGKANAKLGLAAEALMSRSALMRNLGSDRWSLIVRHFPSSPTVRYGDHPYGVPRNDQVFQAWDGGGFGEMEYHSPVLDAQRGPRALQDRDQLWVFGGSLNAVAELANLLLKIDVRSSIEDEINP